MKMNNLQLEACAYIFEIANGNDKRDFRYSVIESAGLKNQDMEFLEKQIVDGIENNLYPDLELRGSAYWALSKRFNPILIPYFNKWLINEYSFQNDGGLFQLMIALDNLEIPVFGIDRTGYAAYEKELNYRDAKNYLDLQSA